MDPSSFKPVVLTAFRKSRGNSYVLSITSFNASEDVYEEIEIRSSDEGLNEIKDYIGTFIFFDLIDDHHLEFYTGEHFEESSVEGPWQYDYYVHREIEKTSRAKWKPRVVALRATYGVLFNEKLPAYAAARAIVVQQFRKAMSEVITSLPEEHRRETGKTRLFDILFHLFESNPAWDSMNKLIDPEFQYYPAAFEDWKAEYDWIEKQYHSLLETDTGKPEIVLPHIIELYRTTYRHLLWQIKYNYPEISEALFDSIISEVFERMKVSAR